jgi:hypothetical protein
MRTGVKVAEHPEDLIGLPLGQQQKTVIVQIAQASFGSFTIGILVIAAVTALIWFWQLILHLTDFLF